MLTAGGFSRQNLPSVCAAGCLLRCPVVLLLDTKDDIKMGRIRAWGFSLPVRVSLTSHGKLVFGMRSLRGQTKSARSSEYERILSVQPRKEELSDFNCWNTVGS